MSRHREVRRLEYDDYAESDYGSSYPESLPELSSSMEKEFLFVRDSQQQFSDYLLPRENEGNDEPQGNEDYNDDDEALMAIRERNLSPENRSKLHACLETILDVLGLDTIPESRIKEYIIKCEYDSALTLNTLLNNPPTVNSEASRVRRVSAALGEPPLTTPMKVHRLTITEDDGPDLNNRLDTFNPAECTSQDNKTTLSESNTTPKPFPNTPTINSQSTKAGFKSNDPLGTLNELNTTPKPLPSQSTKTKSTKNDQYATASESSELPDSSTPSQPLLSTPKAPKPMRKVSVDPIALYASSKGPDAKDPINLIVTGHVDSGKSTLLGHLLALLGVVPKKTLHKYETESRKVGKSSFSFAWIMDETSEERSRGVTIHVGSGRMVTPLGREVILQDAPGHKDFIPNMIGGSATADAAVLVVNASPGEFEVGLDAGGQTREHGVLLRSLGVSPLIVAVNKLDAVTWNEGRFTEIRNKMEVFLKGIGYRKGEVNFVPVSGLSGENLTSPCEFLKAWKSSYGTLLDLIEGISSPKRLLEKPFRLAVNDVFKAEQSSGISLAGRVLSGFVLKDDRVLCNPSSELGTVKNLLEPAFAGDSVVLNVVGLSESSLSPGCVLSDPQYPLKASRKFRGRLVVFDGSTPLVKGASVVLHSGCVSVAAVLSRLLALTDKSSGSILKKNPRCLPRNSNALVEISVESPIVLELYSETRDLGRFMLRSAGVTLAAGLVTEIA